MGSALRKIMGSDEIDRTIRRIAHEIIESNHGTSQLVLLGIPTRGCPLARQLAMELAQAEGEEVPVGDLDITMYRDDLGRRSTRVPHPTHIPVDLAGRQVILVDDVLFSGRTIAAALDALKEYGRPARVQLAVLVDRGHRELPISPDFVGKVVPTAANEHVHVHLSETDQLQEVLVERREA